MPTNPHARKRTSCLLMLGWFVSFGLNAAGTPAADGPAPRVDEPARRDVDFFETRIRPVLATRCYDCHSSRVPHAEGELRLDRRESARKGGASGPAVVPGDPDASLLIRAMEYRDDFYHMPPDERLPDQVIADFRRWIARGAADPRDADPQSEPSASPAGSHWAFSPPQRPDIPNGSDSSWPRSAIDRLALRRMAEAGLTPSPDAPRPVLIRRLFFDLIGLPPTYDQVQAFVHDPSPAAYEQLVDRLLASPHFGECWARHWMDVARYADTKGYVFQENRNYPEAYKYRDWLIQSFNDDLPYDEFLVCQLAADQQPDASEDTLAAMGYLTLGRRFLNNKHDMIDDRIDVVTRGMLGLTVTCARCHDHKYDPIPTEDYYALYGVFASSSEPGDAPCTLRLVDVPQPRNARVFVRGNPRNPGPIVRRHFLTALAGGNPEPFQHGSGRGELAAAIASPDNPLTARVMVNRVWQHLFGAGLVRTPSDFGLRSTPPTQPEVLDDLATRFMDDGWSVKKLIRRIVTSSLYRQASDLREGPVRIDPENRFVWRMPRRRTDFESMRDALLSVTGELNPDIGGPSVEIAKPPFSPRRTLYGFIDRQNLPKMFRTFDLASPDTHAPQRFQTTVPQQALFLMNSPWMMQMLERLAAEIPLENDQPLARQIRALYRRVYARDPVEQESSRGLAFLQESQAAPHSANKLTPWQRYAHALLMANEFAFVD